MLEREESRSVYDLHTLTLQSSVIKSGNLRYQTRVTVRGHDTDHTPYRGNGDNVSSANSCTNYRDWLPTPVPFPSVIFWFTTVLALRLWVRLLDQKSEKPNIAVNLAGHFIRKARQHFFTLKSSIYYVRSILGACIYKHFLLQSVSWRM